MIETLFAENRIHGTVPPQRQSVSADDLPYLVYRYLLAHGCKGKENAEKATVIAQEVDPTIKDATAQPVRKACKVLLCVEHRPVISCTKGMFIAQKDSEIADYLANIQSRAEGLYRIMDALKGVRVSGDGMDMKEQV